MPDILGIQKDIAAIQSAAIAAEGQAAKDLGALLATTITALNTIVGGSLADITAERTEAVNDGHGFLDRLNGAKLMFVDGGFRLDIPSRQVVA